MSRIFRSLLRVCLVAVLVSGPGCFNSRDEGQTDVHGQKFTLKLVGKSDLNMVMDINIRESREYLHELMEKLYRRNPRELKKSRYPSAEDSIQQIFSRTSNWNFQELGSAQGVDAIELAFKPDFEGDRVFAFMAGLTAMLMSSYDYKTDFYMLDNIGPQGLYNCARNIEIAAWRLSASQDESGEPLIYSNSLPGEETNYSYANLFGKLTSLQDSLALVVANKTNRTISKVIQRMATAVFLPIP